MLIPALLALAVSAQPIPLQSDCDSDCIAILEAATGWAVARVDGSSETDRARTFINIASSRSPRPVPVSARTAALREIASRFGIGAMDAADHEGRRACVEQRVEACRAAEGTTVINLSSIESVTGQEVIVHVTMQWLSGRPRNELNWVTTHGVQLFVGRVDGEWRVVREGIHAIS